MKFQDGLKPYLKNKISILKLGVYSKVVDRALIAERDSGELYQYREQQKKRNRSYSAHGNHIKKKSTPNRNRSKGKVDQNSYIVCPTCRRGMGTGHVIERQELGLVVGSKGI